MKYLLVLNLDIFLLISSKDIVSINGETLIPEKNGQCNVKHIMMLAIKTTSVLKISTYIITSTTAHPIRLNVILGIMSVPTFTSCLLFYVYYCLFMCNLKLVVSPPGKTCVACELFRYQKYSKFCQTGSGYAADSKLSYTIQLSILMLCAFVTPMPDDAKRRIVIPICRLCVTQATQWKYNKVSDCILMPIQQFFTYIMVRTS